ncbi:MAG: Hg(II)-responsive transcriptional regulator [Saccharospirillaceae bacterium]|nr:Hg(II)-responsive transcriptional regulator [Pseudomonadales bacterium]NRB78981.1 Hg(II)-responsive transcriptional regulator [Saccharospirillaceae bacterium]
MVNTISKVAKSLGINIETVRFYERKGLIQQPNKPKIGYRDYPKSTVDRIAFIKRSQELGFTLNEIQGLLNLNDNPCKQVQEMAETKLLNVQQKMQDLQQLERALKTVLLQCEKNANDEICPLIDALKK